MTAIDEKESYDELTVKQAAGVDAIAKNPDKTHEEQAEIASAELSSNETISRPYISILHDKAVTVIEDRRELYDNQRDEGTVTTEGNPFETDAVDDKNSAGKNETGGEPGDLYGDLSEDETETGEWQMISERPVKDSTADSQSESAGGASSKNEKTANKSGKKETHGEHDKEEGQQNEIKDGMSSEERVLIEIEILMSEFVDMVIGEMPERVQKKLVSIILREVSNRDLRFDTDPSGTD